jgi:hypothetical protein
MRFVDDEKGDARFAQGLDEHGPRKTLGRNGCRSWDRRRKGSRAGTVTETDRVVGVALICPDKLGATAAFAQDLAADAKAAGKKLAAQLGDPAALGDTPLLVWFDPMTGANVQALIDGLAEGGYTKIISGGSGQPWGPLAKTYQYFDRTVMNDSVVALKLTGVRNAIWETSHGGEPIGLEVTVTEAEGNVIRKLDGKPALDVWSEQLLGAFTFHVDDWNWVLGMRLPESDPQDPEGHSSRSRSSAARGRVRSSATRRRSRRCAEFRRRSVRRFRGSACTPGARLR